MAHRDAQRRCMRRLGALVLLACAPLALVGCHGTLLPVMAVATATPVANELGLSMPHGPTVTVFNEADVPVDVRLWAAKADYREPAGFREQRTADRMTATVLPGQFRKVNAGRSDWPTGQFDGVVWMRLVVEDKVSWYEFQRPGPYRVTVRRAENEWFAPGPIEFVAGEGQVMTPLPESAWIEHRDGNFPANAPAELPVQDLGDDPSAGE